MAFLFCVATKDLILWRDELSYSYSNWI
jgi:hypothetical protein